LGKRYKREKNKEARKIDYNSALVLYYNWEKASSLSWEFVGGKGKDEDNFHGRGSLGGLLKDIEMCVRTPSFTRKRGGSKTRQSPIYKSRGKSLKARGRDRWQNTRAHSQGP